MPHLESSLPNVWLANGYRVEDSAYGRGVFIDNVEALHRAIGHALLRRPRLTGAEILFLRKELGRSKKGLAEIVGTSEQTVSLWERNRVQMPAAADRVLRLLYAEHVHCQWQSETPRLGQLKSPHPLTEEVEGGRARGFGSECFLTDRQAGLREPAAKC